MTILFTFRATCRLHALKRTNNSEKVWKKKQTNVQVSNPV